MPLFGVALNLWHSRSLLRFVSNDASELSGQRMSLDKATALLRHIVALKCVVAWLDQFVVIQDCQNSSHLICGFLWIFDILAYEWYQSSNCWLVYSWNSLSSNLCSACSHDGLLMACAPCVKHVLSMYCRVCTVYLMLKKLYLTPSNWWNCYTADKEGDGNLHQTWLEPSTSPFQALGANPLTQCTLAPSPSQSDDWLFFPWKLTYSSNCTHTLMP